MDADFPRDGWEVQMFAVALAHCSKTGAILTITSFIVLLVSVVYTQCNKLHDDSKVSCKI